MLKIFRNKNELYYMENFDLEMKEAWKSSESDVEGSLKLENI